MTKEASDKEFLEFIVKNLVDNPDSVEVERKVDEMGVLLALKVHPDDMGQIIGKEGSTARAIRNLVRIIGLKRKARVNLKIIEPGGGSYQPRTDSSENRKEGLEDIKL
jgi:uncharacterized protein